jgi:hypothetical protein
MSYQEIAAINSLAATVPGYVNPEILQTFPFPKW